jgi:hypothetical protein
MDYNHITSFFDRVKQLISFPVDKKMIRIKGEYIHVEGSPLLRNEILIHKEGILKDVSLLITGRHFKDIK